MKTTACLIGLAAGLTAHLAAGETLCLKLEPEYEYLIAGSPQEVVVKIDLSASVPKRAGRLEAPTPSGDQQSETPFKSTPTKSIRRWHTQVAPKRIVDRAQLQINQNENNP